jgi:hypothetical protein
MAIHHSLPNNSGEGTSMLGENSREIDILTSGYREFLTVHCTEATEIDGGN